MSFSADEALGVVIASRRSRGPSSAITLAVFAPPFSSMVAFASKIAFASEVATSTAVVAIAPVAISTAESATFVTAATVSSRMLMVSIGPMGDRIRARASASA